MYKNLEEVKNFFEIWNGFVKVDSEIGFFPQFPLIMKVKELLKNGEKVGAQNCSSFKEGAYTGEVSPFILKDCGCDYVIIGHSERRHIFGEKNDVLKEKLKNAILANLKPIYCVGEKLSEREEGKTVEVIMEQLNSLLEIKNEKFEIAYEPVWAIGTGRVAKPEDASKVHFEIKKFLKENNFKEEVRVLYGGSVKPENARELLRCENIDGLLVGGASLDPRSFYAIATAI